MTTLRMTTVMTKMPDNNVTLYFFPLITEHFTHYLVYPRLHCSMGVGKAGYYYIRFPERQEFANNLPATR